MTKELIPQEVKYLTLDKQEVTLSFEIIKNLLVHGKPDLVSYQEAAFFMEMCKARGLNPFKKDCYLIKYNQDPAAIIVSIDYYRSRAYAQSDCQGWQVGVITKTKDGTIKRTNGLVLSDEELIGAWFKAQPKGWNVPREHEVNLKGYLQYTKEGNLTKFWRKEKQPTQIMKVVEAQGLRFVWPIEFQKLYIREEMYEVPNNNGQSEPDKATISMDDFKPTEGPLVGAECPSGDDSVEPPKEQDKPDTPKVSLKELKSRIFKACVYLAEKDKEGALIVPDIRERAKIIYHEFADFVDPGNPVTKEDENGDKYTEFPNAKKVIAKALNDISIDQARTVWGKIKEHCEEIGIDIKKELNYE
ncbi:MAG: phage recombination protein Bet [Candidatus Hermodarchaeota archaeon]